MSVSATSFYVATRRFDPPLQPPLYIGLAITSNLPGQISEAKFSDLRFETPARR